jgi:hypothetical protein
LHQHYERILTDADNKHYILHPFTLPAGCVQLIVRLAYAPAGVGNIGNVLSLTLFDPQGFRGAGHCRGPYQEARLSAVDAAPGYIAGPLTAGSWTAEIETHGVAAGEPCRYTLDILTEARPSRSSVGESEARRAERFLAPAAQGAGWYRGDLHTHTVHSDGDIDVAGRIRAARARGLDFFYLTDHNTVSGLVELASSPERELLALGGMELTTFWGHALCLGTRQWIDWRVKPGTGQMPAIARAAAEAGQVFVIAHPHSLDDPYCTGCAWHFDDASPGPAHAVEVWNGPWDGDSNNESNLDLWYRWLNVGHRLAATAGTDAHGAYEDGDAGRSLGFNVVYARERSEAGILEAIRLRHLYLSSGPRLILSGRQAGGETGPVASMGDVLCSAPGETAAGRTVEVVCRWESCPPGAVLRSIVDGRLRDSRPVDGAGSQSWTLAPGEDHWCTAELRDGAGDMLALTNPIFLSEPC